MMVCNRKVNFIKVFWYSLYWIITVGLIVYRALDFRFNNPMFELIGYSGVASRSSAESLKFQSGLIILLMCRAILFRLRVVFRGKLACYLPLDYTIKAHIYIGIVYIILVLVHIGGHLCNFYRLGHLDQAKTDFLLALGYTGVTTTVELFFTTVSGVSGLLMTLMLIVGYLGIYFRKTRFNVFFGTHFLLLLVLACTIFHGVESVFGAWTAPYYIGLPLLLYLGDKLYILVINELGINERRNIKIISTRFVGEKQNILHLVASKPRSGFDYIPGSYCFLKVPGISSLEWHPFTIASTPADDHLSFYIKNAGDWTEEFIYKLKTKSLGMLPPTAKDKLEISEKGEYNFEPAMVGIEHKHGNEGDANANDANAMSELLAPVQPQNLTFYHKSPRESTLTTTVTKARESTSSGIARARASTTSNLSRARASLTSNKSRKERDIYIDDDNAEKSSSNGSNNQGNSSGNDIESNIVSSNSNGNVNDSIPNNNSNNNNDNNNNNNVIYINDYAVSDANTVYNSNNIVNNDNNENNNFDNIEHSEMTAEQLAGIQQRERQERQRMEQEVLEQQEQQIKLMKKQGIKVISKTPKLKVFGPCSSPAQNFRLYKYGIYIATGVGITPFLSILKHMYETRARNLNKLVPMCDGDNNNTTNSTAELGYVLDGAAVKKMGHNEVDFIDYKEVENDKRELLRFLSTVSADANDSNDDSIIEMGMSPLEESDSHPSREKDDFTRQTLIWCSRSLLEFDMVSVLLLQLASDPFFDVQLYYTAKITPEEKSVLFADGNGDNPLPKALHHLIRFGRPDVDQVIANVCESIESHKNYHKEVLGEKMKKTHSKIGVFCTVPQVFKANIRKVTKKHHLDFHPESF